MTHQVLIRGFEIYRTILKRPKGLKENLWKTKQQLLHTKLKYIKQPGLNMADKGNISYTQLDVQMLKCNNMMTYKVNKERNHMGTKLGVQ